jgi:hypothetical protein
MVKSSVRLMVRGKSMILKYLKIVNLDLDKILNVWEIRDIKEFKIFIS